MVCHGKRVFNYKSNLENAVIPSLISSKELCTGGSITDLVHELRQKNSRLNDNQIAYILRETVQALIYLHQNHCMHRDIKGQLNQRLSWKKKRFKYSR